MDNKCAFDCHGKCVALREQRCAGCNFYKTEDELEAGRVKAAARITRLEPSLKQHLKRKYYGDRRMYDI